jgi:hypothetical protein
MKMRLILLMSLFLLTLGVASGQQFRLVGNPSGFPTTVNDSTYTLSVTFASDQTGNGFLPTQIPTDGSYRMFFQNDRVYKITDMANVTFSAADLTLVEYFTSDGAPSGQGLAYDPQGRETVPQAPANASGASPLLNSVIATWNLQFNGGIGTELDPIYADDSLEIKTDIQDLEYLNSKYFFSFDEAKLIDGDTLSNEFPNVAYDPNTGRLAMIYRKGTSHNYSPGAKAVVRYSDDNGDNWSDAIDAISFGGNTDVRDPGIFWDDSTSQYIAFGTIRQSETIDSIPEFVVLSRSNDATVWSVTDTIQNPESRAVFRPTTNIVRKGDSLLLTAYFQSLDSVKLYFLQSIDNGVNWTNTIVDADNVTTGPNEGQIVIHSDTMFLFTRAYPNNFFRYYSTDNGATWSLRTDITPDNYNGTNPNIEIVDDSIFVMTHRQSGGGSPVVSLSYDNGLTWTEPDLIPYINGLGQLDYSDFQKINDNLYYHAYSQNDNIRGQLYIRGFGYDANNLSKYRYYTIGESKVLKDGLYYADPNKFRYWIGNDAGSDDSGSIHQVAIGYQAGINNTNQHQNAIGALAGEDNTGIYQTAIGVFAGRDNTGDSQSTVGAFSGSNNTGLNQSALGTYAGRDNTGYSQVALGHRAGQNNSGSKQVVLGERAGQNNSGAEVIQIGSYAGQNNESNSQVVIGNEAGRNNTGVYQTAIGIFAGRTNSGDEQVAIGRLAGDLNSGDYGVFLGFSAGRNNTFNNVIAIGRETYPNDSRQIVIGNSTHYDNTIFPQKVSITGGLQADNYSWNTDQDITGREGQVMTMRSGKLQIDLSSSTKAQIEAGNSVSIQGDSVATYEINNLGQYTARVFDGTTASRLLMTPTLASLINGSSANLRIEDSGAKLRYSSNSVEVNTNGVEINTPQVGSASAGDKLEYQADGTVEYVHTDTTIAITDVDYNVATDYVNNPAWESYNIFATVTAGAASDTQITAPTPGAAYAGSVIRVKALDASGSFDVTIGAGGTTMLDGTTTSATITVADGEAITLVCLQNPDDSTWYWTKF